LPGCVEVLGMSRYGLDDDTKVWEAVVVQEWGPDDVDVLSYLAHESRADPFRLGDEDE
jgi:hypothetical protein